MERASRTAESVALARALESLGPTRIRLFDDPYAARFLGSPALRAALACARFAPVRALLIALRERSFPGSTAALTCRTQAIDEALRGELAAGTKQVAILGAGFDSRALRIPGAAAARVFELDRAAMQARKRARLGRVPAHVAFVPIDFERESIAAALGAAGHDPRVPTCFLWEGVTQYLTPEAFHATLRDVAAIGAPGSALVFTYIEREAIERGRPEARSAAAGGEPWIHGLTPSALPEQLAAHGFAPLWDRSTAELAERAFASRRRRPRCTAHEHVALARRVGAAPAA